MISKDTLFAVSLFPYLGFLWFLTRCGKTPRLALIGFYFLLVFVFITIPAGIYSEVTCLLSFSIYEGLKFQIILHNCEDEQSWL